MFGEKVKSFKIFIPIDFNKAYQGYLSFILAKFRKNDNRISNHIKSSYKIIFRTASRNNEVISEKLNQ